MKININFTIDIPKESIPALLELAVAKTISEARDFLKYDAEDYLRGYLENNGVNDVKGVSW